MPRWRRRGGADPRRRGARAVAATLSHDHPATRLRSYRVPCYGSCHDIVSQQAARPKGYCPVMATVVSLEGKRKTPSLEPLLSLCADGMAQIDREILVRM